jgi:hypothetical protein
MIDPDQDGGDERQYAHHEVVNREPRDDRVTRVPAAHGFSACDNGHDADDESENGRDLVHGNFLFNRLRSFDDDVSVTCKGYLCQLVFVQSIPRDFEQFFHWVDQGNGIQRKTDAI